MPSFKSLLEYFPQLESIYPEKVIQWLKGQGSGQILENEMGNRILYPQTIPLSERELFLEMAILREALKVQPSKYYNRNLNRLFIDVDFLERFPDASSLVQAFVDALQPVGLVSLILRSENVGSKSVGTLLRPRILKPEGKVTLWVGNQKYDIEIGSFITIPSSLNHLTIKFDSPVAKILDHHKLVAEVSGGRLGVVVDTRGKEVEV
ncbi:MAG: hypothetical protein UU73_C0003G0098 [Candidatus Daviesbacteria bacterium GW2011_GWA1_41_61]|uniref:Uncharacterized protein n=1 Tax=Candidatus Daviesbacteria bacterium GW2011_GWA2_40_9 TaxID=1618424 RepID=A0A0G0U291_9BACT|nr:MAG: hypothetical protein UU26_C0003G0128 [Candidatus Daviesbacteria bacterium GW2011_GWC1_40_9]KKR83204.1 MAG: hypothetical protein UU29_C0007G0074 [Candidatus Daviesbacteria bacterium GW2011_GWA2_40_9]KKR93550.1 MAG: hypothetical protein UU44_C0002G0211 [Candidatus Daviesbacteria bacterium GW2011_GWB1_41_15]KKS14899.1 MAG: hypothetical protein UU73_C0003G0098 [Candidatus Daviesbacteria bacterium GW2011_GWA1_41_61]